MPRKKRNKEKDMYWNMIENYFKGKHLERLVRHQLESYNNFVTKQIKKTIQMFNPVTIRDDINNLDPETGLHTLEIIATFDNYEISHIPRHKQ